MNTSYKVLGLLFLSGCSLSPQTLKKIELNFRYEGQRLGADPFSFWKSPFSGGPPNSYADFDCLAVNVIGASGGRRGPGSCSLAGVTSKAFVPTETVNLSLEVSPGAQQTIQVLGFVDPNKKYCGSAGPVGDIAPFSSTGNSIYELGATVQDIFTNTSVTVANSYDPLISVSEKTSRDASCAAPSTPPVATIPTTLSMNPTSGGVGTLVKITGTDFTGAQSATIGGTSALILGADSSSLDLFVMPQNVSGPITVTISSQVFTTPNSFTRTVPSGTPNTAQGGQFQAIPSMGADPGSHQGQSVALSADGNTAAVGAYADRGGKGAVWIFSRTPGTTTWQTPPVQVSSASATAGARQGEWLALSADGNTLIIGGTGENTDHGAAWVFTRNPTSHVWDAGVKLVTIDENTGGGAIYQGSGVAISADGKTVAIGADHDASGVGAAWVFDLTGGGWTQNGTKFVSTNSTGSANQGANVALSADGKTLLVGGTSDDSGVGAGFVYSKTSGAWSHNAVKLVGTGSSGPYIGEGSAVALSADGNVALLGGPGDNSNVGSVWAFLRDGAGNWDAGAKIPFGADSSGANSRGSSVSLNADGTLAAVGQSGGIGAAWIFTRSGTAWSSDAQSPHFGLGTGTPSLGTSVSISADGSTAIFGAPNDNTGSNGLGSSWVFVR